jgi:class 3 adenylate cyclase
MATEGFKRKLTAILSADTVGYSRLMGEDEAVTVRTLKTYRGVISDLILQYRGRGWWLLPVTTWSPTKAYDGSWRV